MNWEDCRTRWDAAVRCAKRRKTSWADSSISKPAKPRDVEGIESKLGYRIPESLRDSLLTFSASVLGGWTLESQPPEPFDGYSHGAWEWDLKALPELEGQRVSWCKALGDAEWEGKLLFQPIANGDYLALDLVASGHPVVYLSHEGGDLHGVRLADDLADFLDRWTRLGSIGPEEWLLERFLSVDDGGGLDPNGEHAKAWRRWFGLP